MKSSNINLVLRGFEQDRTGARTAHQHALSQAKGDCCHASVNEASLLRKQIEQDLLPWLAVERGRTQPVPQILESTAYSGNHCGCLSFALPCLSDWKQETVES